MSEPAEKRSKWGVPAAVGAGVLASACCTVPLLLVTLGVGGAWVSSFTALEPFRPYFIAAALGMLAYAGYREYRNARGPQCDCEVTLNDKVRRASLVVGALATLALIVSPWLIKGANDVSAAELFAPEAGVEEVALDVEGMTCDACAVTLHKALTRLDGVEAAQVTYEPPRAVVRYRPAVVSLDEIVRATANVGYPGTPVKPKSRAGL